MTKFEKNILNILEEEQIKLGFAKETVRLYYPLQSLNSFFSCNADVYAMNKILKDFATQVKERLGNIEISNKGERFCICLPPTASEYVHSHRVKGSFLEDLINAVSKHNASMDDILSQFKKHSSSVVIKKMTGEEFDYLAYFENGIPDDFYYCLKDEGCHIIYHRFTPEDYAEMYG